jgi:hypothetical protein
VSTDRLPDFTRTDAGIVLVSPRWVAHAEEQTTLAEATIRTWEQNPLPTGLLSLSCFLSADGETVLAHSPR